MINCSTSCAHPDAGGLETTLPKTVLTEQTQWKQYKVSNVSNATVAYCHFTCSGKQKSEDLRISTYRECGMAALLPQGRAHVCGMRPKLLRTAPGHSHYYPPPAWTLGAAGSRTQAMGLDSARTLHWPL